jgi:hypothetical protein
VAAWEAFQENKAYVREMLEEGFIDHMEVVSRVTETQFFQKFIASGDLARLAESFPSPRKKEEVPLWLYLSSQMTLRLHGSPGFSSLPYVLHCGGLRDALGGEQVEIKEDPQTHARQFEFKGYNEKNDYARTTPCDQDFVRKLARDTEPHLLEHWYGTEVARYFRDQRAYDPEGIFIVDGSYLFVPDNDRYERSKVAVFDEHNHPISKEEEKKLPPAQQRRCRFRRYYEMVALSHTNRRKDFLLYSGATVLSEDPDHEVHHLVPLVDRFVNAVGRGIMKTLLVDRGFIDGKSIGRIKREHEVDVVIPLKAKMAITEEAWKLAEVDGHAWQEWRPPERIKPPDPPQRPESIRRAEKNRQKTVARQKKEAGVKPKPHLVRVELKAIPRIDLWDECTVPLDVVLMREYMSDGETAQWGLMTTREVFDPLEIRELYELRPSCEEGWRQTKCYWDLSGFRSCQFSLIVSQVIFVLMSYSLLQLFLIQMDRGDLAKVTRERLLQMLLPDGDKVAIYFENHVGYFSLREYTDIILNLAEGARRRLQGTVRRLRKAELEPPALPERPT